MLGADKTDPKKPAAQAQGAPKAPSAKAADAHPGQKGCGQCGQHHPGAKGGAAPACKATAGKCPLAAKVTADGKCPYCHQSLAAKGPHKGHHGKAGFGHHGKGHKGHHGKAGFGHHGKGGFGHHGKGGFGHHGKGGFGHHGKCHKGHHGKGGFGHHGKCHKGHHGKGGFGHHGKGGFGHHGKCHKGHHGKGGFGQHKPMAGRPGMPPFGPQAHGFRFGGQAGGFHPPFRGGMALKMPSADELFKLFDTNGDGKIDKAEFEAGLKKIREKIQQRFQARLAPPAARGPLAPPPGPKGPPHGPMGIGPQGMHRPGGPHAGPPHQMPSVAEIFEKLDKNKDGKLTKDEVPARMWEHLSKAGVVKDGAVTKDALEAFHKKMLEERAKKPAEKPAPPKTVEKPKA
jgi:hypothetical protein